MTLAILSDIHANLEALQACIERLSPVADRYLCLGDVVGYGPNPNECCEVIQNLHCVAVVGNHDQAAIGQINPSWFNPLAAAAVRWTQEHLSESSKRWLLGLSEVVMEDAFEAAHGALDYPATGYITDAWSSTPTFDLMKRDLCFVGHTHVAAVYAQAKGHQMVGVQQISSGGSVELKDGFRYILNPGAVGQPRDGIPKASCAAYNTEARVVTIMRVDYPVQITQRKMRDAGLPELLWRRLAVGR